MDLVVHPEWRGKCKGEIRGLLSSHLTGSISSATLCEKLAAIPLLAWEDELPVLDASIRKSRRIVLKRVLMQKNVGRKIKIGGQVTARGGFLAYGVGEVHLNPEYYLETYKYDPDRWLQPDLVPRLGGWSTRLYGDETGKVGDEAGFGDVFDEIRVRACGREWEIPQSLARS